MRYTLFHQRKIRKLIKKITITSMKYGALICSHGPKQKFQIMKDIDIKLLIIFLNILGVCL